MKINQKGFSVVEILTVVVIVGLIGTVGWLVYDRRKDKTDNQQTNTQTSEQKQETLKEELKNSNPYNFKELGISMDILNGWEVKSNPTLSEGANFYSWTVQKTGADGKIELSSTGFRGGFEGCEGNGSLTAATVKEVAPTQNANLMFMSWSYSYDNETNNRTGIVPMSETVFRATNNGSATAVANKDVKAGSYFFCISEPEAGFSLKLNNEAATGFSRMDRITALSSSSSGTKYLPLPANAHSYADIKTMLTTIK
jgi:prepilin-type N-terminal cleavage/methylation domain-containing protein